MTRMRNWGSLVLSLSLVAVLLSEAAAADPAPLKPSEQQLEAEKKSSDIAFGLALGVPTLSIGSALFSSQAGVKPLMYAFLIEAATIAPSMGHVYVGEYAHAAITSGIRSAIIGSAALILLTASSNGDSDFNLPKPSEAGIAVICIGAIMWPVLVLYDLIDAPRAAKRHNDELEKRYLTNLTFTPMVVPPSRDSNNLPTAGLVLSGAF